MLETVGECLQGNRTPVQPPRLLTRPEQELVLGSIIEEPETDTLFHGHTHARQLRGALKSPGFHEVPGLTPGFTGHVYPLSTSWS